jgi:hypothetical protein
MWSDGWRAGCSTSVTGPGSAGTDGDGVADWQPTSHAPAKTPSDRTRCPYPIARRNAKPQSQPAVMGTPFTPNGVSVGVSSCANPPRSGLRRLATEA